MEQFSGLTQRTVSRRGFGRWGAMTAGVFSMTPILGRQPAAPGGAASGPARLDIPLDAGWRFAGPLANPSVGYAGSFVGIDLPHSVATLSWRDWDPASWEANWLYRRDFDLPVDRGDARFLLRFDGALTAATPTVNGHRLPRHLGGYLPFTYEITEYVRDRDNRLDVLLDGRFGYDVPPDRPGQRSSSVDFWQLAGLYRGVTLRMVPRYHLSDVFAKPRHVLDPAARLLDVECTVDVPDGAVRTASWLGAGAVHLEFRLFDGHRLVASSGVPATLSSIGANKVSGSLTDLGDVELWSTDAPKRYQLVATLRVDGVDVHDYQVPVRFRQAELTSHGFFLNGRPLRLFGLNRHQFYPYVGGAMPARVQRRDAAILKDLNCNMVRCSHYPQDTAFLDACDELGLLVFDEVPGWGYLGDDAWQELVLRDVRQLIVRDRNHPSVVLWGVRLNETPDNTELYTPHTAVGEGAGRLAADRRRDRRRRLRDR
jgi:beta-galactosidase